jgi:hypothetical protein
MSASTSSGKFSDFRFTPGIRQRILRACLPGACKQKARSSEQPITVAGPWPIFTAFPKNKISAN